MNAGSAFGVFGFMGFAGLLATCVVIDQRRYQAELERRRADARAQVRGCRVLSPNPRYAFDGQTATIVLEQESMSRRRSAADQFSLTCYAANEVGEYFMFISNGAAKPFVKHVEPRIARVVLQGKYRDPRAS